MICNWSQKGALILTAALLTACGGGGSSSVEEGVRADLSVSWYQRDAATGEALIAPAGTKSFSNSEGVEIELDSVWLNLWSLRLSSDCSQPGYSALARDGFKLALDWMIPPAAAHSAAAPELLGVPHMLDLTSADREVHSLGTLAPPVGGYCGGEIELLAADDDTEWLPPQPDLVGVTLKFSGRYRPVGGDWAALDFETGRALLPRKLLLSAPMMLSASQRRGQLVVGVRYDRWFNGVDPAQLDDAAQRSQLFANVSAAIEQYSEN